MLWWDDGFSGRRGSKDYGSKYSLADGAEEEKEEIVVSCFRSTGSVPIPRKISRPNARRKLSMPVKSVEPPVPERKVSLPVIQRDLAKAQQELLQELKQENITIISKLPDKQNPSMLEEPSANLSCARYIPLKIYTEKVKTEVTEPEVKKELKRGSMKEKWGLTLSYNFEDSRLSVGVIKVSMFSPAAKAGVSAGSIINVINDWAIEAMDKPEVAMSILLAAGFSVNLAWRSTKDDISSWKKLDLF